MSAPSPSAPARRGYLDWLRGLAVLVMIEAHLLDSWTRYEDRGSDLYRMAMIAGGFGAPLFLFLAGVAVPLSAASKLRRTGDPAAAASAVVKRGLEIFGLAFLFRLQACIVSWGPWRSLLKVDILNIMGPSIMAAAAAWAWLRTNRSRCIGFAAATMAVAFLTPPIRATPLLARLPDPLEGYIRPIPGLTNFVLFPWAGFLFAGAVCGTLLSDVLPRPAERKIIFRIAGTGCAMTLAAYAASFFPSPYEKSDFWTSSPSFFFLRTGILVALIGAAFAWEQRPWNTDRFSPLQRMGRSSLFIYWIHIELIYGLMVRPLHKSVGFPAAALSIPLFAALMLLLSMIKDKLIQRYR
jgi:uncharacterized membrane protein